MNLQERFLAHMVKKISTQYPEELPSRFQLLCLHFAWGNYGFMAGLNYLKQIARATDETKGPILECGSGLTTLLMAMLTKGRNIHIYSLEHHPIWQEKMTKTCQKLGFDHVSIINAPLKNFGDYDWYDVDKANLPMDFNLVICDGPPGKIKGSRYGLIPEMDKHLTESCTILLDDAGRKNEKQVIEHWERRHGFAYRMKGVFPKFAMVNRAPAYAKGQ